MTAESTMQASSRTKYSSENDQSIPKYVNSTQAIEDFHQDIQTLRKEFSGPLVLYGTSYSGTLAIEIASRHPEDANLVVSSSGIAVFSFASDAHDQIMQSDWPQGLYAKMASRIASLEPTKAYDQNWQDRLFLQYAFIGSVQYKKFKFVPELFSFLDFLPTKKFI